MVRSLVRRRSRRWVILACTTALTLLALSAFGGSAATAGDDGDDVAASAAAGSDKSDGSRAPEVQLHFAAGAGDAAAVRNLLASGVDPNSANAYGETALHMASIGSADDVLAALLAAGGDASRATEGQYEGHDLTVRRTPLMWAAFPCWSRGVEMLLDAGADPNYVNEEGQTALDIAKMVECPDVAALLVARGGLHAEQVDDASGEPGEL